MAATESAHPALRVPVPGDGAGSGRWEDVAVLQDGTPVVVADPTALLEAVGSDAHAPLDELSTDARAQSSRYLQEVRDPGPLRAAIADTLRDHAGPDVDIAVEAGCAVGVDSRSLAAISRHVVAFDSNVAMVRVARRLLTGEPVPQWVRHEGRRASRLDPLQLTACANVTCIVGDALDPPIRSEAADVVLAANLVDSIHDPLTLLGQLDAILAPGGLLVLASPFDWHDHITPPELQLGGGLLDPDADGPEMVSRILAGETPWLPHLRHEVIAEDDVEWRVRTSDRSTTDYLVRIITTRKLR